MIQTAIKFSIWRSAEIVSAEVKGTMSISVVPTGFASELEILHYNSTNYKTRKLLKM